MLTLTLRGLERDGLVKRTVFPTIPPRVDYELTKQGLTLLEPIQALSDWADDNRMTVQAARDRFDAAEAKRQQGYEMLFECERSHVGLRHVAKRALSPPSTFQIAPVTKLARGDARNATTWATSSGSPMRLIG
jgi:hypothetical protein